ncbi:MAG: hypothetical protein LIP11_13090 [Clostridiales bacterium]|nr:hypothetical protein [Clostridiales bacterium]
MPLKIVLPHHGRGLRPASKCDAEHMMGYQVCSAAGTTAWFAASRK